MNLLAVTYVVPHPDAVSGASLVMFGQLKALAARHEVTLLAFAAAEKQERRAVAHLRSLGITVHELGGRWPSALIRWKRRGEHALRRLRHSPPAHSMTRIDPRMQHRIDRLLERQQFDLVHVESIGFGNYRFGPLVPSVLTEHEVGRVHEKRGIHWRAFQPTIWKQFDRIQVFTSRDAETVRMLVPELADRVRVNPFGIDIGMQVDPRREDPNSIVFVGGFRHLPNVDAASWLAAEIMPLLRSLHAGVRAIIVGSHPPDEVRALAGRDIDVMADVPAVEPFLEKAAVVVAPVRQGGGMRLKVLQAMAMGKAVVTTSIGAEGVAAFTERPLTIADDAQRFAGETAALLADIEKRRRLGEQARAFVQAHHTWEAYTERLEAIYAQVAPRRASR